MAMSVQPICGFHIENMYSSSISLIPRRILLQKLILKISKKSHVPLWYEILLEKIKYFEVLVQCFAYSSQSWSTYSSMWVVGRFASPTSQCAGKESIAYQSLPKPHHILHLLSWNYLGSTPLVKNNKLVTLTLTSRLVNCSFLTFVLTWVVFVICLEQKVKMCKY